MSDTLPSDVALVLRLGPIGSARRQRRYAGSDVQVWCDVVDRITAEPILDAGEFSGLYWPPDTDPDEAEGQPLAVTQIKPGVLQAMVPGVIPGTYAVSFRIGQPVVQVGGVTFDVASDTTGHLVVGATIPWSSVQAAAAAMGASAGAAEARVVGGTAGAAAGATAGAEAAAPYAATAMSKAGEAATSAAAAAAKASEAAASATAAASAGATAGATAGASAGSAAGTAAAAPVIAQAAADASTATTKAAAAAASQVAASTSETNAATSATAAAVSAAAAATSANGVTLNPTNAGDFAVFKSLGGRVVARIKRATGVLETMGLSTRSIAATSAAVSGPVSATSLTAPTTQTANANLQTSGRAGQFLVRSLGGRVTLWLDSMAVLRGVGANFRTIAAGSLTVGGQPITAPVAPAVYAPVTVSAATIADLNTWVAGMTLPGDVVALPGRFSTDAAAYGWRYAWLSSSPAVTGRRHWVIAYGQNTRPGDGGEGTGGFCFLRYCDDLAANVWREVLYIIPASPSGANVDPQLRTLADGRLLVMYSSGPTGAYGFIIQNPEAVKGSFDIGRTYFLDRGTPMKPEYAGADLRGIIVRSGDAGWQYYGSLTFSGRDAISFTRLSPIPLLATGYNNFPETSIVPISGGRTRAWFRTNGYGTYKTLSDIGDASWNTAAPWADYVNNGGSRASFARSPYSGYIFACWNRNATARRNLSIAYSTDDGATFTGMVEVESRFFTAQSPQYPILTFANGWIYWSYDFGRDQSAQLGPQTILARIREDKVIAGTATEADVEKYIAATAGVIP